MAGSCRSQGCCGFMYRILLFLFGVTCIVPIIIGVAIEKVPKSFATIGLVIMGIVTLIFALVGLLGSCGMHNNISMMFFQIGGILFCIIPWIIFLGFSYQNPRQVAESTVAEDKDKAEKIVSMGRWGILVGVVIQIITYVYCCFFTCCFMGRRKFYEDAEGDQELGRRVTSEESGYGEHLDYKLPKYISFVFELRSKLEKIQGIKEEITKQIQDNLDKCVEHTDLKIGTKKEGKVRDIYDCGENLIIITTDRLSAFDRVLTNIPFKGQVLNMVSQYWFNKTKHIIQNAIVSVPNQRSVIMKKFKVFPIEFVVRGYMTGSTSTSIWTQYKQGVRNMCGIDFREGYTKNQQLDEVVITPTTKSENHDVPISPQEIIQQGIMSEQAYNIASKKATELFKFGQQEAGKKGLILVDTKYEIGYNNNLQSSSQEFCDQDIFLIDEIHTPDSSRYWFKDTYNERLQNGEEPQNIDKEFVRLWYQKNCNPYDDKILPKAPDDLRIELSKRYIYLYEKITGQNFVPQLNFTLNEDEIKQ